MFAWSSSPPARALSLSSPAATAELGRHAGLGHRPGPHPRRRAGRFSGGVFEVRQALGGRGVTQIILVGGHWAPCRAGAVTRSAAAHAATRRRKPIRRLWGSDDRGRFQARGGDWTATVPGTRWLTEEFCDGTRTTVTEGAVSVHSGRTGRAATVRAGHSRFVARRPRRAASWPAGQYHLGRCRSACSSSRGSTRRSSRAGWRGLSAS